MVGRKFSARLLIAYLCVYFIFPASVWAQNPAQAPAKGDTNASALTDAKALEEDAKADDEFKSKEKEAKKEPTPRDLFRLALHLAGWKLYSVTLAQIPGLLKFRKGDTDTFDRPYFGCKNNPVGPWLPKNFPIAERPNDPNDKGGLWGVVDTVQKAHALFVAAQRLRDSDPILSKAYESRVQRRRSRPPSDKVVGNEGAECFPALANTSENAGGSSATGGDSNNLMVSSAKEAANFTESPIDKLALMSDSSSYTLAENSDYTAIITWYRTQYMLAAHHAYINGVTKKLIPPPEWVVDPDFASKYTFANGRVATDEVEKAMTAKVLAELSKVQQEAGKSSAGEKTAFDGAADIRLFRADEGVPRFVLCSAKKDQCREPETGSLPVGRKFESNEYCYCDPVAQSGLMMPEERVQALQPADPDQPVTKSHEEYFRTFAEIAMKAKGIQLIAADSVVRKEERLKLSEMPNSCGIYDHKLDEFKPYKQFASSYKIINDLRNYNQRNAWIKTLGKAMNTVAQKYSSGILQFPVPTVSEDPEFYDRVDSITKELIEAFVGNRGERKEAVTAGAATETVALMHEIPFSARILEGNGVRSQDLVTVFSQNLGSAAYLIQQEMARLTAQGWKQRRPFVRAMVRSAYLFAMSSVVGANAVFLMNTRADVKSPEEIEKIWDGDFKNEFDTYLAKKNNPWLTNAVNSIVDNIFNDAGFEDGEVVHDSEAEAHEFALERVRQIAPLAQAAYRADEMANYMNNLRQQRWFFQNDPAWLRELMADKKAQAEAKNTPACFLADDGFGHANQFRWVDLDPNQKVDPVTKVVPPERRKDYEHFRKGLVSMLGRKKDKLVEIFKSMGMTDAWVQEAFAQRGEFPNNKTRIFVVNTVDTLVDVLISRIAGASESDPLKDPQAVSYAQSTASEPIEDWLNSGDEQAGRVFRIATHNYTRVLHDKALRTMLENRPEKEDPSFKADFTARINDLAKFDVRMGNPNVDAILGAHAKSVSEAKALARMIALIENLNNPENSFQKLKAWQSQENWVNYCSRRPKRCQGLLAMIRETYSSPELEAQRKKIFDKMILKATQEVFSAEREMMGTGFLAYFGAKGERFEGESTIARLKEKAKAFLEAKPKTPAAPNGEVLKTADGKTAESKPGESKPGETAKPAEAKTEPTKTESKTEEIKAPEMPVGPSPEEIASKAVKAYESVRSDLLRNAWYGYDAEDYPVNPLKKPSAGAEVMQKSIDEFLIKLSARAHEKEFESKPALQFISDSQEFIRTEVESRELYAKWQTRLAEQISKLASGIEIGLRHKNEPAWSDPMPKALVDRFGETALRKSGNAVLETVFSEAVLLTRQVPALLLKTQQDASGWAEDEFITALSEELMPSFSTFRRRILGITEFLASPHILPSKIRGEMQDEIDDLNAGIKRLKEREFGFKDYVSWALGHGLSYIPRLLGYDDKGQLDDTAAIAAIESKIADIQEQLDRSNEFASESNELVFLLKNYLPNLPEAQQTIKLLEKGAAPPIQSAWYEDQILDNTEDVDHEPLEGSMTVRGVMTNLELLAKKSFGLIKVDRKIGTEYLEDVKSYCEAGRDPKNRYAFEENYRTTILNDVYKLLGRLPQVYLLLYPENDAAKALPAEADLRKRASNVWTNWKQKDKADPRTLFRYLVFNKQESNSVEVEEVRGILLRLKNLWNLRPRAEWARQATFTEWAQQILKQGLKTLTFEDLNLPDAFVFCTLMEKRSNILLAELKNTTGVLSRDFTLRYWEKVVQPSTDVFHGEGSKFAPIVVTDDKGLVTNVKWFRHAPTSEIPASEETNKAVGSTISLKDEEISKRLAMFLALPKLTNKALSDLLAGQELGMWHVAKGSPAERVQALNFLSVAERQSLFTLISNYLVQLLNRPYQAETVAMVERPIPGAGSTGPEGKDGGPVSKNEDDKTPPPAPAAPEVKGIFNNFVPAPAAPAAAAKLEEKTATPAVGKLDEKPMVTAKPDDKPAPAPATAANSPSGGKNDSNPLASGPRPGDLAGPAENKTDAKNIAVADDKTKQANESNKISSPESSNREAADTPGPHTILFPAFDKKNEHIFYEQFLATFNHLFPMWDIFKANPESVGFNETADEIYYTFVRHTPYRLENHQISIAPRPADLREGLEEARAAQMESRQNAAVNGFNRPGLNRNNANKNGDAVQKNQTAGSAGTDDKPAATNPPAAGAPLPANDKPPTPTATPAGNTATPPSDDKSKTSTNHPMSYRLPDWRQVLTAVSTIAFQVPTPKTEDPAEVRRRKRAELEAKSKAAREAMKKIETPAAPAATPASPAAPAAQPTAPTTANPAATVENKNNPANPAVGIAATAAKAGEQAGDNSGKEAAAELEQAMREYQLARANAHTSWRMEASFRGGDDEWRSYSPIEKRQIIEKIRNIFNAEKARASNRQLQAIRDITFRRQMLNIHVKEQPKLLPEPKPFQPQVIKPHADEGLVEFTELKASDEHKTSAEQLLNFYEAFVRPVEDKTPPLSEEEQEKKVAEPPIAEWRRFHLGRTHLGQDSYLLDPDMRQFPLRWSAQGKKDNQAELFEAWAKHLGEDEAARNLYDRHRIEALNDIGLGNLWDVYPTLKDFLDSKLFKQVVAVFALADRNAEVKAEPGTYAYTVMLLNWVMNRRGGRKATPAIMVNKGIYYGALKDRHLAAMFKAVIDLVEWDLRDFDSHKKLIANHINLPQDWAPILESKRNFNAMIGERRSLSTLTASRVVKNPDSGWIKAGDVNFRPTPLTESELDSFVTPFNNDSDYDAYLNDPANYFDYRMFADDSYRREVYKQYAGTRGRALGEKNVQTRDAVHMTDVVDSRAQSILTPLRNDVPFGGGFREKAKERAQEVIDRVELKGVKLIHLGKKAAEAILSVNAAWADVREQLDQLRRKYPWEINGFRENVVGIGTNALSFPSKLAPGLLRSPRAADEAYVIVTRFAKEMNWQGVVPRPMLWTAESYINMCRRLVGTIAFETAAQDPDVFKGQTPDDSQLAEFKAIKRAVHEVYVEEVNVIHFEAAGEVEKKNNLKILGELCELRPENLKTKADVKKSQQTIKRAYVTYMDGVNNFVAKFVPGGTNNESYRLINELNRDESEFRAFMEKQVGPAVQYSVGIVFLLSMFGRVGGGAPAGGAGSFASKAMALSAAAFFGWQALDEMVRIYSFDLKEWESFLGTAALAGHIFGTPDFTTKFLGRDVLTDSTTVRDSEVTAAFQVMTDKAALPIAGAIKNMAEERASWMAWLGRMWMLSATWNISSATAQGFMGGPAGFIRRISARAFGPVFAHLHLYGLPGWRALARVPVLRYMPLARRGALTRLGVPNSALSVGGVAQAPGVQQNAVRQAARRRLSARNVLNGEPNAEGRFRLVGEVLDAFRAEIERRILAMGTGSGRQQIMLRRYLRLLEMIENGSIEEGLVRALANDGEGQILGRLAGLPRDAAGNIAINDEIRNQLRELAQARVTVLTNSSAQTRAARLLRIQAEIGSGEISMESLEYLASDMVPVTAGEGLLSQMLTPPRWLTRITNPQEGIVARALSIVRDANTAQRLLPSGQLIDLIEGLEGYLGDAVSETGALARLRAIPGYGEMTREQLLRALIDETADPALYRALGEGTLPLARGEGIAEAGRVATVVEDQAEAGLLPPDRVNRIRQLWSMGGLPRAGEAGFEPAFQAFSQARRNQLVAIMGGDLRAFMVGRAAPGATANARPIAAVIDDFLRTNPEFGRMMSGVALEREQFLNLLQQYLEDQAVTRPVQTAVLELFTGEGLITSNSLLSRLGIRRFYRLATAQEIEATEIAVRALWALEEEATFVAIRNEGINLQRLGRVGFDRFDVARNLEHQLSVPEARAIVMLDPSRTVTSISEIRGDYMQRAAALGDRPLLNDAWNLLSRHLNYEFEAPTVEVVAARFGRNTIILENAENVQYLTNQVQAANGTAPVRAYGSQVPSGPFTRQLDLLLRGNFLSAAELRSAQAIRRLGLRDGAREIAILEAQEAQARTLLGVRANATEQEVRRSADLARVSLDRQMRRLPQLGADLQPTAEASYQRMWARVQRAEEILLDEMGDAAFVNVRPRPSAPPGGGMPRPTGRGNNPTPSRPIPPGAGVPATPAGAGAPNSNTWRFTRSGSASEMTMDRAVANPRTAVQIAERPALQQAILRGNLPEAQIQFYTSVVQSPLTAAQIDLQLESYLLAFNAYQVLRGLGQVGYVNLENQPDVARQLYRVLNSARPGSDSPDRFLMPLTAAVRVLMDFMKAEFQTTYTSAQLANLSVVAGEIEPKIKALDLRMIAEAGRRRHIEWALQALAVVKASLTGFMVNGKPYQGLGFVGAALQSDSGISPGTLMEPEILRDEALLFLLLDSTRLSRDEVWQRVHLFQFLFGHEVPEEFQLSPDQQMRARLEIRDWETSFVEWEQKLQSRRGELDKAVVDEALHRVAYQRQLLARARQRLNMPAEVRARTERRARPPMLTFAQAYQHPLFLSPLVNRDLEVEFNINKDTLVEIIRRGVLNSLADFKVAMAAGEMSNTEEVQRQYAGLRYLHSLETLLKLKDEGILNEAEVQEYLKVAGSMYYYAGDLVFLQGNRASAIRQLDAFNEAVTPSKVEDFDDYRRILTWRSAMVEYERKLAAWRKDATVVLPKNPVQIAQASYAVDILLATHEMFILTHEGQDYLSRAMSMEGAILESELGMPFEFVTHPLVVRNRRLLVRLLRNARGANPEKVADLIQRKYLPGNQPALDLSGPQIHRLALEDQLREQHLNAVQVAHPRMFEEIARMREVVYMGHTRLLTWGNEWKLPELIPISQAGEEPPAEEGRP